jgi:glycosyltransferase involved in cell wall biosynthesis
VAIPFFNEQKYLAAAVESVRCQTEGSWELLLVDDGSTDGSSQLADEIAGTDPTRIFVLRHQDGRNRGLPASRNLAIDRARGEFLCFLDADDLWSQHKLAAQLEMFRTHPRAVMVCGPSLHQPSETRTPGPTVPVCKGAPRLLRRSQFARKRMRGTVTTPPPSDPMFRVRALQTVGGVPHRSPMAQDQRIEDQRLYVAISLLGPVFVDDRRLTTYTVRHDSISGSARADGLEQVRIHREFERWVVKVCLRAGPRGLVVIAALLERRLRRGVVRRLRMRSR